MAMVGGDEDVLRTIAEIFLTQGVERVDALLTAVPMGDSDALERAAHSLKGTASTLGMARVRALSFELEQLGASGKAGRGSGACRGTPGGCGGGYRECPGFDSRRLTGPDAPPFPLKS